MSKARLYLLVVVLALALVGGCTGAPGVTPTRPAPTATPVPPAAALLPSLPGYNQVEGQTLTAYIGTLSQGAAILAGQPELAATLGAVDRIVGCYQQVGAVRARLYSDQASPLSAGAIAIGDRKELLNPTNLFRCVVPNVAPNAQAPAIQPCTASYTLSRGGNDFYIIYAGTTTQVCQTFCSHLEGCTAHKP